MANLSDALENAVIVALAKSVSESIAKQAVAGTEPGEHEINELIHLCGTLKVGEPYDQTVPAKARPWLLLHLFAKEIDKLCLALAKATGESYDSQEILSSIIEKHVHNPSSSQEAHIKKRVKEVIETLGETTVTTCNGKTKFEGTVNPIEPEDIEDMDANLGTLHALKTWKSVKLAG